MTRVFMAEIPSVFGYGLVVFDTSAAAAEKKLRASYYEMRSGFGLREGEASFWTFKEALDYFAGGTSEIELGKTYFDGVRE